MCKIEATVHVHGRINGAEARHPGRSRFVSCLGAAVVVAAASSLPASATNAACRTIRFERGASSAVIRGDAPAEGVECLRFGAGQGQTVRVSVKSPRDQVAFTIDGMVDNQAAYTFRSEKKNYDLLMHQTFRAVAPVRYELTLSIR